MSSHIATLPVGVPRRSPRVAATATHPSESASLGFLATAFAVVSMTWVLAIAVAITTR